MKENLGVHQILALTENPSLIWTVLEYSLNKKEVGVDLFSRSVARQVSSAPHSLTSVFGMGTGGPCAIKTPTTVPVEAISGSFSFNCLTLPKISTTLILFCFAVCFCLFGSRPASRCWHWPIFPARRQASIFGSAQLNFCVRNGYRWTLCDKNTNCGVAPLPYVRVCLALIA